MASLERNEMLQQNIRFRLLPSRLSLLWCLFWIVLGFRFGVLCSQMSRFFLYFDGSGNFDSHLVLPYIAEFSFFGIFIA